jgi:hypothetical protein
MIVSLDKRGFDGLSHKEERSKLLFQAKELLVTNNETAEATYDSLFGLADIFKHLIRIYLGTVRKAEEFLT